MCGCSLVLHRCVHPSSRRAIRAGRTSSLVTKKRRRSQSSWSVSLHIMLYIVMLACDRWHKMCQTVWKSADKLMLTIICGTVPFCSLATFALFVIWRHWTVKMQLLLETDRFFFPVQSVNVFSKWLQTKKVNCSFNQLVAFSAASSVWNTYFLPLSQVEKATKVGIIKTFWLYYCLTHAKMPQRDRGKTLK